MAPPDSQSKRNFTLANRMGLHARPASMMAELVRDFSAKVTIHYDGNTVAANSVLGILTLAAEPGSELTFHADGEDAEEVLDALEELFNDRFGEG